MTEDDLMIIIQRLDGLVPGIEEPHEEPAELVRTYGPDSCLRACRIAFDSRGTRIDRIEELFVEALADYRSGARRPGRGAVYHVSNMTETRATDVQDSGPPERARRWLAAVAGPEARIEAITRVAGATSTSLHAIDIIDPEGSRRRLLLRRYINRDWLRREPDVAAREAAVLGLLAETDVPAPRLVAVDENGSACGAPAVLTEWLPGAVSYMPTGMQAWLEGLAGTMAAIHAVDDRARDVVQQYSRYHDPNALRVPDWTRRRSAWEVALEVLRAPPPERVACLIHRDYHPGNVLWLDGRPSGVLDWVNASWGPPEADIAHCRLNLAKLHGRAVADRFLDACLSLGRISAYHPYWDLNAVADMEPEPRPHVYQGWLEHGITHLTAADMQERTDDIVVAAVARL